MVSYSIWKDEKYHPLTNEQISRLEKQGCLCNDWSKVKVAADFNTDTVHFTNFSGQIRLSSFTKQIPFLGGITKPSGIRNATLHNCIIKNNAFINNVNNYIANYIIEEDVIIENMGNKG